MGDSWKAELTVEMMPDGLHRAIAEEIGVDNLLKLARLTGGITLYIQREETILRPIRDRKIAEEFNSGGVSAVELMKKYGVTERTVRDIASRALHTKNVRRYGGKGDAT